MPDSASTQKTTMPAARTRAGLETAADGRESVSPEGSIVRSAPVYSRPRAALAIAAASVLMTLNTAAWTARTDYAELGAHRRLWSDLADAVTAYLGHRVP